MITPRDVEVLSFIHDRRFVTVDHLAGYLGMSRNGAQKRLTRLAKSGLVRVLPYRITDSGALMLAASRGCNIEDLTVPRPSQLTKHYLAIGDFYLAALPFGVKLFKLNPTYPLRTGLLMPDVLLVIRGRPHNRILFVEVDRGDLTRQSMKRVDAKIVKGYNVLANLPSRWREDFGSFPEVLIVSGRAKILRPRLAKLARGYQIHVCTMDEVGSVLGGTQPVATSTGECRPRPSQADVKPRTYFTPTSTVAGV